MSLRDMLVLAHLHCATTVVSGHLTCTATLSMSQHISTLNYLRSADTCLTRTRTVIYWLSVPVISGQYKQMPRFGWSFQPKIGRGAHPKLLKFPCCLLVTACNINNNNNNNTALILRHISGHCGHSEAYYKHLHMINNIMIKMHTVKMQDKI